MLLWKDDTVSTSIVNLCLRFEVLSVSHNFSELHHTEQPGVIIISYDVINS